MAGRREPKPGDAAAPSGRRGEQAHKRAQGALETEILGVLWTAEAAMTPAAVQEALAAAGIELAHTTVATTLNRLVGKDLVSREAEGRTHAYAPVLGPADHAAAQMQALLDVRRPAGTDRAGVLQRFVAGLDPADEALLRALVNGDGGRGDAGEAGRR